MTRLRGSISATSLDEVVAWTLAPATVHARREWSKCRRLLRPQSRRVLHTVVRVGIDDGRTILNTGIRRADPLRALMQALVKHPVSAQAEFDGTLDVV